MSVLATNEIGTVFFALFLLLSSSFICGKIFEIINAPKVVGEIVGGMLIGASCIGHFYPEFFNSVFNSFAAEGKVLNIFYQLGLVLLMFMSGFNTTLSINRKNAKNYILLFLGATIIPMMLGLLFVPMFQGDFTGTANNEWAFAIVFVISVAITSIPVISKIFFDIGMMNTNFSNMVLTVSTLQDLCLWILLNMAISLVQTGTFNPINFLITTGITIGLLIAVKLIEFIFKKIKIQLNKNIVPISLCIMFVTVYGLSKLNINIMYSAFIAGYLMKAIVSQSNKDIEKIKDFAFSFFVPVYFALVGLQLDVIHDFSISRFFTFFGIAFGLEFVGTVMVMLFTKLKKKTIFT